MTTKRFSTYAGWRKAAREMGATRFEGDKDIAQAWAANGNWVGEWDGAEGFVVGVLRGQSRAGRMLLRGGMPGRDDASSASMGNPVAYRGKLSPHAYGLIRDAVVAASPYLQNIEGNILLEMERGRNVRDINKRLRWDALWVGARRAANNAFQAVYAEGANDDNIDAALRSIWRELEYPVLGTGDRPNPVVDHGRRVGVDANQVNAVLRREGVPVILTRGKGDYYWRGSWGQPLEGVERVPLSLAENAHVDQLVEAGRDAYEGWRRRTQKPNPRTPSGDVPKRDALVSLGAFVATLPEDEELGGEELGWVADKAIELGLAAVSRGVFRPSRDALRVHPTNEPMKAGLDALRVLHDGDWTSHEAGQMAEVARRARKWYDKADMASRYNDVEEA
jgi:hypothetical protein